jgi:CPA1 family monovalent cation:H+ antiporter
MSSILEGESLLNDASSLIIFRFALIAVATGHFIWYEATLSFGWMIIGGVVIGMVVGWIFMKSHQLLPGDTNVDVVLTIIAPYVMYLLAEEIHSSGVIAVVCGGLFLSSKRYLFLGHATRLRGTNVWESLIFVLNGLVFLLIGLDLPEIVNALKLESISLFAAIKYGLLITAVLIAARIFFSFMAVFVTLIASRFIKVADARNPGYKLPVIFGWTGMRGVVSLAVALSIPIQLSNGTLFPHRNLILFITFVVILSTLLLQGLTLPYLIKKIKWPDFDDHLREEEAEILIRKGLDEISAEYFAIHYGQKMSLDEKKTILDILNKQRDWLLKENQNNEKLDEEIVRKFLFKIDMEEARVTMA